MSTYVMSDIHGCFDEFMRMIKKIKFAKDDMLILAGDSIERGTHSYEMLKWMKYCPANIRLIRGNHEEAFAACIDLMTWIDEKEGLGTDYFSNRDTKVLYSSVQYYLENVGAYDFCFDLYSTIKSLINDHDVTLKDLCGWAEMIRKMPFYLEVTVGDRACIVVHAGYVEKWENAGASFSRPEEFYLYAREESLQLGGKQHGMVIAGHTPTIVKGTFAYNKGKVFRYYDEEIDCIFYDIDCGCVFRSREPRAGLACIRLEDERIFYIK